MGQPDIPEGPFCSTTMELGTRNPIKYCFSVPNSILVLQVDPLASEACMTTSQRAWQLATNHACCQHEAGGFRKNFGYMHAVGMTSLATTRRCTPRWARNVAAIDCLWSKDTDTAQTQKAQVRAGLALPRSHRLISHNAH